MTKVYIMNPWAINLTHLNADQDYSEIFFTY